MELENKSVDQNEIDIVAIVRLLKRKWYVFLITMVAAFAVAAFYFLTKAPQYSTTATILIKTDDPMNPLQGMNFDGFMASDLLGTTKAVDDEMEILRSKKLVKQMIDELGIRTAVFKKKGMRYIEMYGGEPLTVVYPPNFETTIRGSLEIVVDKNADGKYTFKFKRKYIDRESYKCSVTSLAKPVKTPWGVFSFVEHPENIQVGDGQDGSYALKFKLSSSKSQIDSYVELINVELASKKSNAVSLSYTSSCPAKNEAILNKIIDLYNLDALSDKNRTSMQMANFITDRLVLISAELKEAEIDVENYRREHNIANISTQSQLFLETSSEYEKRIAEADIQYSLVSFVENYLKKSTDYDLIPNNTGIEDKSLGDLIVSYNELVLKYLRMGRSTNETNPIVEQTQHQIALLRQNILQTIRNVKKSIEITKTDLKEKNKKFTDQISDVPTMEREYVAISRQQRIKQGLYMSLLQKREETQLTLASTTESAKIIDAAYTAETPVAPKLKLLLLIAFVLGGALGAAYLYVYASFNNRIQDKHDLKHLTKLPIIGYIPFVKGTSYVVVSTQNHGVIDEMFRSIRANLKFVLKNPNEKVMLVTSSIAGEGKSFFSINLALSLAMLNKRVALVGLDIRKPMLAKYLNVKNAPGVTNFLSDKSMKVSDIVVTSPQNANLDVYVGGTIPPNPAELLNDSRLDELFEVLRAEYDYVIIDSAPIGLVSDTFIINHVVDAVLYVTRQGITPREHVQNLAGYVSEEKLKNVSLVLNGVPETDLYGYGYGNYVTKSK